MRSSSHRLSTISFVAASLALACVGPVSAKEDWQIGHGPFLSAADVRPHNKMPLDIRDVNAALRADNPDWQEALARFAFGGHFDKHSLAIFTDNYNDRFPSHLPVSTEYFGDPGFQNHALTAAIIGTGKFRPLDAKERIAFIGAALEAATINWSRYELGESQRKGTATEANWSLQNGSPKNWNEIFAFYWGPEGEHSAFAAVEKLDGGGALNTGLFQALHDGQAVLVEKKWSPEHAADVGAKLNEASVLLLKDALQKAAAADEADLGVLRAQAAGYWLAAAEAVAKDAANAAAVEAALKPKSTKAEFEAALKTLPSAR